MHHETQAGAYLQQIESHRRLITEGRTRLREQERLTEQARSIAVQLENENAALAAAYDEAMASLYRAGIELCECPDLPWRHVQGVPGCTRRHDPHEDRLVAA